MLSTEFSVSSENASPETIDRRLTAWRDSLIDLTRRNPLLDLPVAGGTHLILPGLVPGALSAALSGRRPLSLMPQTSDPDDLDPQPAQSRRASVGLSRDEYRTLESLRRRARRSVQEQGVHTLFAAMGVLERPDPTGRGAALRSPLLLVPVTLERSAGGDALCLRRFDDDAALNPALQFPFEQNATGPDLPQVPDGEPLDPDTYLMAVQEAVAGRAAWSVAFDCLVGCFSPQMFEMYRDLEALAPSAPSHPLVCALAGDREAPARLPAVTLPAPEDLDAAPEDLHHVSDADPSQRLALLAARRGQSFVLHGPPGTGASQTIASIIADGIAEGKRVLFVSHKAAALDAVYALLRDRGLATFCLEAHGPSASKKRVLEQLRAALEARVPDGKAPDPERKDADRLAAQLNQSVAALHAPRLPLGLSVYEANGLVAGLPDAPDLPFVFPAPDAVTRSEYRELEEFAARLAQYHDLLADLTTHPWRGVLAGRFDAGLPSRVRASLAGSLDALDGLAWEAASLARVCHLETPQSVGEADRLLEIAALVREMPRLPPSWLAAPREEREALRAEAQAYREREHSRRDAYAALNEDYEASLFDLPLTDLEERLDERHEPTLQPAFGADWRAKIAQGFDEIDGILSRMGGRIARVRRAAALLAESLGLPEAETIAASADLLRVAGQAASLTAPPGWLEPEALPRLIGSCAEARRRHETHVTACADLMEWYTEGLFSLELPGLHARFDKEYAGPLRFFNSRFHADMRLMRSVSRRALPVPEKIAYDLALAQVALSSRYWIDAREQELKEAFGSRYEGDRTDWAALMAALKEAKAFLDGFPGGAMPAASIALSDAGRRALTDRLAQAKSAFAAFGETLRALGAHLEITGGLPFTDRTLPHAPLTGLAAWMETLREAATDYDAARRLAVSVRRADRPLESVAHLAGDIAWAAALRRAEDEPAETDAVLMERFGAFRQGPETDWNRALAALEWTERLHALIPDGAMPDAFIALIQGATEPAMIDLAETQARVRARREALRECYAQVQALFPPERLQSNGHTLETLRYEAFGDWLKVRLERLPDLERWIGLQTLRADCERTGLLSFFEAVTHHRPPSESILPAFRKRFHRAWLDSVLDADAVLRTFRGADQETRIARFAALDARRADGASDEVRALAQARRPTALFNVGEAAVLRAEMHRKRQTPVRSLLGRMPNLLACLKPCLLMSPSSISRVLDPERISFDLVIFDEASQISVQDALGALLRARQVIVAGDGRQLPPAPHFAAFETDAEESGGKDSILDAADALASEDSPHFARRFLTWHTQSRDESLIAFSRRNFYPHLTTFPSARPAWAVAFEYVPDGARDSRGACLAEALRVAELVAACVRSDPDTSLGVIAFGEAQRDAVEQALAERLAAEPDLESPLDADCPDGFFVKTAENAQGDARDVIFLSVGEGLGPDGDARLLNVAVTRARRRCVVVSSLLPSEIVSERPGPRLLREYLEYAFGGAQAARVDFISEPSAFEQAVEAALTARGHRLRRQVGVAGSRISLAVIDPSDPARYRLGIECDGPAYRDIPTASARDRLRPDFLRGLSWRLLRVWSSDWVRSPDVEIARIEAALIPGDDEATPSLPFFDGLPRSVPVAAPGLTAPPPPGVTLYERVCPPLAGGSAALDSEDASAREDFLCSLVGREGPLALDAAAQRLASAAGSARASRRVHAILEDTVDAMVEKGILERRESFLWTRGARPSARVPRAGDLPRPLDHIALEEIGEIALALLQMAFGMRRAELVLETLRILGCPYATAKARHRVDEALALLELDNRITVQGGRLRPFGL